jgi:FMN reductase
VKAVTLVGNPITPSRTRVLADAMSGVLGELGASVSTIDLALLPVDGLAHGRPEPEAQAALDAVLASELLLIVTPIYKATFTGLLKLVFDALPHESLRGKVAIPVIVGAWQGHFLVIDHGVKPVLSALGAIATVKGQLVLETTIDREAKTVAPEVLDEFRPLAEEALRLVRAVQR